MTASFVPRVVQAVNIVCLALYPEREGCWRTTRVGIQKELPAELWGGLNKVSVRSADKLDSEEEVSDEHKVENVLE